MFGHQMLIAHGGPTPDMDKNTMAAAEPDAGEGAPSPYVSVFRPGRLLPTRPQPVDLAVQREVFSARAAAVPFPSAKVWESLGAVGFAAERLLGNGLFLETGVHPVAASFDLLRTRLLAALRAQGWRRIAVTSPTHGCGKTFVATNLALSLARRPGSRTVLIDLDLRRPEIARLLGLTETGALDQFLTGEQPLESQFHRFGKTLALGLNAVPVPGAAERLHDPQTAAALHAVLEALEPEVMLLDLPPALVGDDLLALAPALDAVLLVCDGTQTAEQDIRACERLLEGGGLPLLGVVLNRSQERGLARPRRAKG